MNFNSRLRSNRLKKSVITSAVGKLSSIALQIVSLPLAAAALGVNGFAAYSVLTSILAWLSLSNLGVAPAVVLRISTALGQNNKHLANKCFVLAQWLTLALTSVVSVGFLLLLFFFDAHNYFLGRFGESSVMLKWSVFFVVAIFFASVNLSVVEAAQTAYQETYILNTYNSFGLLLSAGVVVLTARWMPAVISILIAVNTPVLLSRSINAYFFLKGKAELGGRKISYSSAYVFGLLKDGLRFSAAGSLNNFLSHFFPILVIGKICAPSYVASFSAVMSSLILLASFFAISAVPLSSALAEANARNENAWIRSSYAKVVAVNMSFALLVCIGLVLFGEQVFDVWYQKSINPDPALLSAAGVYFVLLAIEVTNFSFLSAIGYVKISSLLMATKSILFALSFVVCADKEMISFPLWLAASVNFIFSSLPLTLIAIKAIKLKNS